MARNGDGIYTRKDRPGYWISYKDSDGRRRRRKVEAPNRTKAADLRSGYVSRRRPPRLTACDQRGQKPSPALQRNIWPTRRSALAPQITDGSTTLCRITSCHSLLVNFVPSGRRPCNAM